MKNMSLITWQKKEWVACRAHTPAISVAKRQIVCNRRLKRTVRLLVEVPPRQIYLHIPFPSVIRVGIAFHRLGSLNREQLCTTTCKPSKLHSPRKNLMHKTLKSPASPHWLEQRISAFDPRMRALIQPQFIATSKSKVRRTWVFITMHVCSSAAKSEKVFPKFRSATRTRNTQIVNAYRMGTTAVAWAKSPHTPSYGQTTL